ncbi:MAG: HAD-IB family phosphatase [Chloroflexia bacterium]
MQKILITEPLHEAGTKALEREFDVEVRMGLPAEALAGIIGGYDAVITRSGTAMRADMLEAGVRDAGRLRVVGRAGIGVDNIDIKAATARGVAVVNAPIGNVRAAAEHTIALIFALSRNVPQAHNLLHEGVWGKNHFMGCEVADKTLGIIGLGKVGTQVARRGLALDMKVMAYDPFASQPLEGIEMVAFDDLLRQADYVTLHVPLTPLTANMIGERELRMMKESAFLVNCARGKVVDEGALYTACKMGHIKGAALDVYASEPLKGSPLLELENVIMTPHLGGTTHEAMRASALEVAGQVRAVLLGEYPAHILNPEVLLPVAPIMPSTLNVWDGFRRVIFDCDSTLTRIEGIDELAAMNGVPHEIAHMTRQAMDGQIPFEEIFGKRLEIIKPTRKQLAGIGKFYVSTLMPDAAPVAEALQGLGVEVHIVSGGYREALLPVAEKLDVPPERVHANDLYFDDKGDYTGFDMQNPLSRSGGKADVIKHLPREPRTMLVGDGASDAEVGAKVELFVGFGGVERRDAVRNVAPVYLNGESLAPLLVMAAGLEGTCTLLNDHHYRPLVVKGLSILMREGETDYRPEYRPFFDRIRKFCLEGV